MLAENFIVKGKAFFNTTDKDRIKAIKSGAITYLVTEGFENIGHNPQWYNFGCIQFVRRMPKASIRLGLTIKRFLNLMTDTEYKHAQHMRELLSLRDEIVYEIGISIYQSKFKEYEGTIFEITVRPSVFFKLRQAGVSRNIDREQYSYIQTECTETITNLVHALSGYLIEMPKPLDALIITKVIESLETFGFKKTSELLKKGRSKIENGNTLEGIDELKGAIEDFYHEAVKKIDKMPLALQKPEENLNIIASTGYLDRDLKSLALNSQKAVYSFVNNQSHPRKAPDLITARFCFDETETVMNYILERVFRYKIRDAALPINHVEKEQHNAKTKVEP
ncbi:MAG: hypothetical protein WCT31_02425 [Candidatus Micrarchaeia archaeon]|jgi:hypothetical protein